VQSLQKFIGKEPLRQIPKKDNKKAADWQQPTLFLVALPSCFAMLCCFNIP
jgi:hypothetical protein